MKCKYHLCKNELTGKQEKYCSRRCGNKAAINRRRVKVKKLLIEHLGGKCEKCGYDKSNRALEFHHKDPTEKDFGIASIHGKALHKQIIEVEKCMLLCANCHAEEHERIERIRTYNSTA